MLSQLCSHMCAPAPMCSRMCVATCVLSFVCSHFCGLICALLIALARLLSHVCSHMCALICVLSFVCCYVFSNVCPLLVRSYVWSTLAVAPICFPNVLSYVCCAVICVLSYVRAYVLHMCVPKWVFICARYRVLVSIPRPRCLESLAGIMCFLFFDGYYSLDLFGCATVLLLLLASQWPIRVAHQPKKGIERVNFHC